MLTAFWKPVKKKVESVMIRAFDVAYQGAMPVDVSGKIKIFLEPRFYYMKRFGDGHNQGWSYFLEELKKLKSIQESVCFVDIGAHIGMYTIPAIQILRGTQSRVYSIEPSQENFQTLTHHRKMNQTEKDCAWVSEQALVSESSGVSDYWEIQNDISAMNSMLLGDKLKNWGAKKTERKTICLDDYFSSQKIDLLKMDVEGAEILVFRGFHKILSHSRPKILMSLHPEKIEKFGYSMQELKTWMNQHRYRLISFQDGKEVELEKTKQDEYLLLPEEAFQKEQGAEV